MNRKVFRSAQILAALILVIATAKANLYAIDSNNRYFAYGVGEKSCADYVDFREKKLDTLERQHERYTKEELYEIVNKVIDHWIAGFLTATDLLMADTYNIAGNKSMEELKDRLETICRANDKQRFAEAMVTLIRQLNPQRVRLGTKK